MIDSTGWKEPLAILSIWHICAPEVFQRTLDQMLEGIKGACATMDGVLVADRDTEHRDQIREKGGGESCRIPWQVHSKNE